MKRTMLFLLLLALPAASSLSQQGDQSKWDKYQPRTIRSVMDANQASLAEFDSDTGDNNKKMVLSANSFPSRVTLIFTGKSRPLQGKRVELLENWKKMLKITDDLAGVFSTEMLFRESDKEYWIAVQKPLLDPLPKEVFIGKPFTAYIVWMGAIKDGDHWEWLFAMNEFDTPTSMPISGNSSR
jgi:hypothetical protein